MNSKKASDLGGSGRKGSFSKPIITDKGDGTHEVSYVPPPVGDPYEIAVRYAGVDIPGSPFLMTCNPNLDDVVNAAISDGLESRKGSKSNILTPEELSFSKMVLAFNVEVLPKTAKAQEECLTLFAKVAWTTSVVTTMSLIGN